MQLVAYGAQDIYLTGNPQITFFKVVYRRHTNFSMEAIEQTINGSQTVGASDSSGTVTISRNGDLVYKVYVKCDQAGATTTQISGDKLIKEVELEIGGQRIDKHYQEWMQVWAELTTKASKANGTKYLTGGFSNSLLTNGTNGGTGQNIIQVPLQFWFCRNPGLALPLIALQYHEVKLKFTWAASSSGTGPARDDSGSAVPTCSVWCDYIYLDTDERRRFAQVSHEYLIEQLQLQSESTATPTSINLNFNHPVKELIWTNTETKIGSQKTKLVLNGHDRFAEQNREYFQVRQCLDYHTAVPGFNIKENDELQFTTPVEIFNGLHHDSTVAVPGSATDGGQAILTNANLTFHVDHIASGVSIGDFLKVGDVLKIELIDANAMAGTVGISQFVQVSVVTSATVITFVAYEPNATATGLTSGILKANDSAAVGPATGVDPMVVHLVARLQEPKSRCSQLDRNINVYSFALKPEEHQPSGTCNFSRIDNAKLEFSAALTTNTTAAAAGDGTDVSAQSINIYAVNYNVLRIMSGMGGLAYSN